MAMPSNGAAGRMSAERAAATTRSRIRFDEGIVMSDET